MKKSLILSLFALLLSLFACSASEGPEGETVSATGQAITVSGHGTLTMLTGSYGPGCTGRAGLWSLRLSGAGALPHPALTVRKKDTTCTLSITEIDDATAAYQPFDLGGLAYGPPIPITDVYAPTAYAMWNGVNPAQPDFYVNTMNDDITFKKDFVITVLYSTDANANSNSVSGTKQVVSGSATAQGVPAPDYTINLASLVVNTDATDTVDSTTGNAVLTAGVRPGEFYVIIDGSFDASSRWGDIDDAFRNSPDYPGSPVINIPSTTLIPDGTPLTATRAIIIQHSESGVPSYQTFSITFSP